MRPQLLKMMQLRSTKNLSDRGFTLAELLIGAALASIVVAVAGYGVYSMIGSSNASNARSQSRVEMNRSLDFITAEIKKSKGLVKDVSAPAPLSIPSNFATSYASIVNGAVTNVLMVDINTGSNTTRPPVIYFVATPKSGLWQGPRVLYRWGPKFNATGGYDNPDTPSAWTSEALVDNINTNTNPISGSTATAPSCASGTRNGDFGFYTCVDAAGKSAQIFQNGKINTLIGSAETYRLSMNTGSRQTTVIQSSPSIAGGATTAPLPSCWTLNGGTVTTCAALTISVRYLGGDIVCGDPSFPIPTFGEVTLKTGNSSAVSTPLTMTKGADTTFSNVAANSTMTVSGYARGNSGSGDCKDDTNGPYGSSSDTAQVRSLKNGDSVPTTKGYLGQASIDDYLTSASVNPATGRPIVNTTTKKIDLAANQVIYLFEFGVTDQTSDAFDLQDMVVLATMTPKN
jgi:prepilin-type N-terminal cleavage/methylation domain-containing protein